MSNRRKISRREFLQVTAMAVGGGTLAACTPTTPVPTTAPAATNTPAATIPAGPQYMEPPMLEEPLLLLVRAELPLLPPPNALLSLLLAEGETLRLPARSPPALDPPLSMLPALAPPRFPPELAPPRSDTPAWVRPPC